MDAHTAQLRHQIDATRAALDVKIAQLEQRVSQLPAALLERHVLGPVRGVQDTAARATTLLSRYPWLILSGRPPDVPLRPPLMASRLAIGVVEGVAGPRPRSVAGGGEASPARVTGAMEGRDPVCDGRRPTARHGSSGLRLALC